MNLSKRTSTIIIARSTYSIAIQSFLDRSAFFEGSQRLTLRRQMTSWVRHFLHSIFLVGTFLFPLICFAAGFTASVDRPQLGVGEQLILELKLSGASPKSSPDILGLQKDFTIIGKQQSSSTSIINGNVSTSVSWQYGLVPHRQGTCTIPAIRIQSSEGPIATRPVTISVEKSSSRPVNEIDKGITLSAKVNKNSPYKNEPVVYRVQLVSQQDLVNIQFKEFSVEGAVVKTSGKPKVYEKLQNGISVKVAELNYIITPLKAGQLTLPGLVIQGEKIVQDENPLDSLLGPNSDPFRLFQKFQGLKGFGIAQLEPFSIASNEITLGVKKPAQNLVPWLPATSLKISETLTESQALKVGEPLTRTFTIVAEGTTANQLPSLKDQQGEANDLKVYGDKPVTDETLKNNKLMSWREESYTLIPQHAGTLTLPEISIPWWNVKENKVEYAKVPARTLELAPSAALRNQAAPKVKQPVEQGTPEITNAPQKILNNLNRGVERGNVILYTIICILAAILLFLIFWMIKIKNKLSNVKEKIHETHFNNPLEKKEIKDKDLSIQEISKIKSAEELQRFLQSYAFQHWGAPKNASLDTIFAAGKKQCPDLSQKDMDYLINSLHDAMYAGQEINLEDIKKRCMDLMLSTKDKVKKEGNRDKKLPDLNPR